MMTSIVVYRSGIYLQYQRISLLLVFFFQHLSMISVNAEKLNLSVDRRMFTVSLIQTFRQKLTKKTHTQS